MIEDHEADTFLVAQAGSFTEKCSTGALLKIALQQKLLPEA
jgi:hypothetical protein